MTIDDAVMVLLVGSCLRTSTHEVVMIVPSTHAKKQLVLRQFIVHATAAANLWPY